MLTFSKLKLDVMLGGIMDFAIAGIIGVAILGFLTFALFNPEKF
ncbi:MAG: potassium-transporting ATPase subunit F [Bdellovibrio sp.]